MKSLRISALIPTYNRAHIVSDAIRSVLDQTLPVHELIVLDDGSVDDTESVVRQIRDSRLKYFRQENKGISATRNKMAKMASGELLAFLDSDDIWINEKLEQQIPCFEEDDVALVFSGRKVMDENGQEIGAREKMLYRGRRLYRELMVDNFIPTSSVVVRRNAFLEAKGFDESVKQAEDLALWLNMSLSHSFDFVETPLTFQRSWSGQITQNRVEKINCSLQVVKNFVSRNHSQMEKKVRRSSLSRKYGQLGEAYAMENQKFDAIKNFLTSLRLNPTNTFALKGIVKLAIGRGGS